MLSDSLTKLVHLGFRKMPLLFIVLVALYMLVVLLAAKHEGTHQLVSVSSLRRFTRTHAVGLGTAPEGAPGDVRERATGISEVCQRRAVIGRPYRHIY